MKYVLIVKLLCKINLGLRIILLVSFAFSFLTKKVLFKGSVRKFRQKVSSQRLKKLLRCSKCNFGVSRNHEKFREKNRKNSRADSSRFIHCATMPQNLSQIERIVDRSKALLQTLKFI